MLGVFITEKELRTKIRRKRSQTEGSACMKDQMLRKGEETCLGLKPYGGSGLGGGGEPHPDPPYVLTGGSNF